MKTTNGGGFAVLALLGGLLSASTAIAQDHTMRISLDTGANSSRVIWVQKFADAVESRSNGRIDTQVFHSGQLFRDVDVPKAIRQGNVQMGVPGSWQLGGFDPRMNMFQLPVMYGRSADVVHELVDGPLGQNLAKSIGERLGVEVIGNWLDLDAGSVFTTTKKIETHGDFSGLTIRFPGGAAIEEKLKVLGAVPVRVPFPDVPMGLQRGNFQGLVSTANTVVSAKLWESGIKYGYLEANSRDQFIPMVSKDFWSGLPDDLKQIVTEEWSKMIPLAREDVLLQAGKDAETLKQNGVELVEPSESEIAATREILMQKQEEITKTLGIEADFVKSVSAALGESQ